MTDSQSTLRSGEVASLAGVSTDTLRYYERRGLLPRPPRDTSGYRRYPQAAVVRVRVIQQALDAGFSIEDLARVFRVRDAGGAPCRDVLRIARTRLDELDDRIAGLTAVRLQLRRVVGEWEERLAATPAGRRAGLLDGLADAPAGPKTHAIRRPVPRRVRR
jgi:MerR family transcriptional regulator, mercuric resistance operon regulatory protein